MSYIYNMTDTWADAATVFTAVKMDVTNTASAANSKLISLQISGTELFGVNKDGNVGIGVSSPGQKLEVNGSVRVNADIVGAAGNAGALGVYGGASYTGGAGIVLYGSSHPTSPNILTFNNGSYVEHMRIDSSGNVGIGTSSPVSKLHVNSSTAVATYTTTGNSIGGTVIGANAAGASVIGTYASNVLLFGNYNSGGTFTEFARIDSSGNVGIGTSSPTDLLDVNSNTIRVRNSRTPASATASGVAGNICWDGNYIYVCTATNTWKRAALSTW